MMQRQGQIGPDGAPLAAQRPPRPTAPSTRSAQRLSLLGYLRSVRAELRKVATPTRLEVRNYSIVVLVTLVVLIALIFVLDFAFSKGAVFLFK